MATINNIITEYFDQILSKLMSKGDNSITANQTWDILRKLPTDNMLNIAEMKVTSSDDKNMIDKLKSFKSVIEYHVSNALNIISDRKLSKDAFFFQKTQRFL